MEIRTELGFVCVGTNATEPNGVFEELTGICESWLLQASKRARNIENQSGTDIVLLILNFAKKEPANDVRYPLVGGTRQCHFDGTHFKPRKLPENAQTPTSRVHALLACHCFAMLNNSLNFIFSG